MDTEIGPQLLPDVRLWMRCRFRCGSSRLPDSVVSFAHRRVASGAHRRGGANVAVPPDDPENRASAVASHGKIGPSRRITNKDMPALSETALVHQHDETLTVAGASAADGCARREREAAAFELRHAFCAQLKAARERRGISLHAISERHEGQRGSLRRPRARQRLAMADRTSTGAPSSASTRRSSVCRANRRSVSSFVCFPKNSKPPRPRCSCPGPLRLTMARSFWRQSVADARGGGGHRCRDGPAGRDHRRATRRT